MKSNVPAFLILVVIPSILLFCIGRAYAVTIQIPNADNYTISFDELNSGIPLGYCVNSIDDPSIEAFSRRSSEDICLADVVINTTADSVSLVRYFNDDTNGIRPEEFWSFLTIEILNPAGDPEDPDIPEFPIVDGPFPPPTPQLEEEITLYAFVNSIINHEPLDEYKVVSYLSDYYSISSVPFQACGQYDNYAPFYCTIGWANVAWDNMEFNERCANTFIMVIRNFDPDSIGVDIDQMVQAQAWSEANKPLDCEIKYYFYEPWYEYREDPEKVNYTKEDHFRDYLIGQSTTNHEYYTSVINQVNAQTAIPYEYIPVGKIIGQIGLGQVPGIPEFSFDELFIDSSPHGNSTTYFMASLITYIALSGKLPPPEYTPGSNINNTVSSNYGNIAYFIYQNLY